MDNVKAMFASWQPTAMAIITAFFGFVLFSPEMFSGAPWLVAIAKYGAGGGLIGLGIVTKQHNVTGGTVPIASNEAAKASVLKPTSPTEGVQK